jgi:CheY-like chemotaxis protein
MLSSDGDRTVVPRNRMVQHLPYSFNRHFPFSENSLMALEHSPKDRRSESLSQPRGKVRIVLVEDNSLNRLLLADYLRFCGYQIQEVIQGGDLPGVLQTFKPDLILLDLKLPDLDGYKLLKQIREHPTWQAIPVIVVSALAFQEDQEKAFELGANRYLIKPVKLDYLHQVIQEEYQRISRTSQP